MSITPTSCSGPGSRQTCCAGAAGVLVSDSSLDLVEHHRGGARGRSINATNAEAPSMRQRIDAADLHAKALRALPGTIGGKPPVPALPDVWPVTLDERLSE
jgi:hypothetical protein